MMFLKCKIEKSGIHIVWCSIWSLFVVPIVWENGLKGYTVPTNIHVTIINIIIMSSFVLQLN